MALTEQQIKTFRQKLEAEKVNLEKQIKDLADDVDFGNDQDHLEEEADETEEITNLIGVRENLNSRLEKINKALKKIRQKTFGRCENCDNEIKPAVLNVVPESEWCQNCKQKS